jgi:hypothetical protein
MSSSSTINNSIALVKFSTNWQILSATIALFLICHPPAIAGTNSAKLTCKNVGGKNQIMLSGSVPASEETLNLNISSGKAAFNVTSNNTTTHSIEALDKGVYTIVIDRQQGMGTIKLYAIPKTVKVTKQPNKTTATFEAIIDTPKPTNQGAVNSANDVWSGIKLSCSYNYEI